MKIRVSIACVNERFVLDDLSDDMLFGDVLALLEAEADANRDNMDVYCDHRKLDLKASIALTLKDMKIHDNTIVSVFNGNITEAQIVPEVIASLTEYRSHLRSNPYELSALKQQDHEFAEAAEKGSMVSFARFMFESDNFRRRKAVEEEERRARIIADPFGAEAQLAIEEAIRFENVEQLRQNAIEHLPESFAQVIMLYIDVAVNGHLVKAFVDSGAQMTIMSAECAERCGIHRLIDRRYEGLAVGVGSQKIIGRVHMYDIDIAGSTLQTSFSILEKQPMDMLLGLDMLRRHQCSIDLKENVLRIGTTGKSTPFLSESELPEHARPVVVENVPGAGAGGASAGGAGGAGGAGAGAGTSANRSASGSIPTASGGGGSGGSGGGSGGGENVVRIPKEAIDSLVQLGVSRQAAIEALAQCGGNVEHAAAMLLG